MHPMGWFLSKNQDGQGRGKRASGKSAKGRAGNGAKHSSRRWDPQRTLLGLKLLGGVALAIALGIGWTATERTLSRYASDARSVPVTADRVVLVDAPSWMDPALRDELRAKVAHSVSADPLDGRGLADAAAMLQDDPWVASVTQVRRAPQGYVKVTADYRAPAAVVAGDRGYHVVDRDGVWLEGPVDRAATRWSRLPLVTGVSADPPATYGKPWPGTDIQAALSLENTLRREPYADQITAYDVSHRDLKGRLWLVLYTDGPAIIWGLPPGQERSVEPQAPVKLGALRDWAYTHGGRIDSRGEADFVWVYTGTAQIDARPTTVQASRD